MVVSDLSRKCETELRIRKSTNSNVKPIDMEVIIGLNIVLIGPISLAC